MVSRKYITVVLFLLVQVMAFAQVKEIVGKIIDSNTRQGIDGVMISNIAGTLVVVSNEQGEFTIILDDANQELVFNHIAYQSVQQRATNKMEVVLLPMTKELEEILVFKRPIHEVFATAFANMKKSVEKGDLYETYVREFNVINNSRVNVADAIVDFYINKPGGKALVDVKERRTFESTKDVDLDNMEELFSVMGTGDFRTTLNSFVSEGYLNKMIKNNKLYDYTVKKQKRANGQTVIVLEYGLKDIASLNAKDFSNKEGYIEGYMVFDESQTNVLEYRIDMAEESKRNMKEISFLGIVKIKLKDFTAHVLMTDKGKGVEFNYGVRNVVFDITMKKEKTITIDVKREIKVDKLTRNVEIPKQKSFKDTGLFGAPSNYHTVYWKGRNIRPLTIKETAILEVLEEREIK
ncbi:MAG: carboxypeptidase-like regulatory domain-containing protein [Flavobacteriaceae bacterium]|jgi:nitrate reductase NapAB chaperone NapD|nr:carboxypeptidase-like regulatory domain-containing protein [Flavobacteriaceae bacterium]